ncbi:hypothetical protein ACVWZ4_003032 [Bradyrhizobium sp. USDA 4472]
MDERDGASFYPPLEEEGKRPPYSDIGLSEMSQSVPLKIEM